MRNRQPISPETVYRSLDPMTYEQARVNSGSILRPLENTLYIPTTSRGMNDDEFYQIEREEGFFTNTDTLRGTDRRMHLLGTVTTRTLVVPEFLPEKPGQLMSVMSDEDSAKIAVANVSITSMYPIRLKAEYATSVRIAVTPSTPARHAAARGVAAFLNGGEGLPDADVLADFDARLERTRQMAYDAQREVWELLESYREKRPRNRFNILKFLQPRP